MKQGVEERERYILVLCTAKVVSRRERIQSPRVKNC